MIKVNDDLEQYRGLFAHEMSSYVMESVIAGLTQADVFVDNLSGPQSGLIWDGKHSLFVGGEGNNPVAYERMAQFARDSLVTETHVRQLGIVKMIPDGEVSERALLCAFGSLEPSVWGRALYTFESQEALSKVFAGLSPDLWGGVISPPENESHNSQRALADGCELRSIDESILLGGTLENLDDLIAEVNQMWGSVGKFLDHGFGTCVLRETAILGWCTAEYVSESTCVIGIETITNERGNGLARAMTLAFVRQCEERAVQPYWDCWHNNVPSNRTAWSAGFRRVTLFPAIVVQ